MKIHFCKQHLISSIFKNKQTMEEDKKRKREEEKQEPKKNSKNVEDPKKKGIKEEKKVIKEEKKGIKEEKKEIKEEKKEKEPTEAEKKKARLLAWKKIQELKGLGSKVKEEKGEEKKENKENKEEDSLDSFMVGIMNEHEKIMEKDEKKFNQEKCKTQPIESNEGNKRKGLDDEEEEMNFTKLEEKNGELVYAGLVAPKKKLFDIIDHSLISYTPIRKDFYTEVEEIKKMSEKEVKKYRRKLDHIKITGKNCPRPIKAFTQCGLNDKILKVLKNKNYTKPTPIQCQAIPALMKGEDVIGIAKTGSGKTLAFLLPMFRHILDQPPLEENDGPIALLMAPTRELALQIHQEAKMFCKAVKLRSVCVYGG